MHYLVKIQLAAVERDRGCDIVNDVADADTGHHVSSVTVTGIIDPRMAALAQGAQRVVRTLWRLARTFLDLQDLFDDAPAVASSPACWPSCPSSAGGSTNAEPSARQPHRPND